MKCAPGLMLPEERQGGLACRPSGMTGLSVSVPWAACSYPTTSDWRFTDFDPVNKRSVSEHGKKSFLSVVVPAKNEAASLTQLIDEIIWALRPLTQPGQPELDGFEIVVVDDASTDSKSFGLAGPGNALSGVETPRNGDECRAVGGDDGRHSRCQGELDRDPGR